MDRSERVMLVLAFVLTLLAAVAIVLATPSHASVGRPGIYGGMTPAPHGFKCNAWQLKHGPWWCQAQWKGRSYR